MMHDNFEVGPRTIVL